MSKEDQNVESSSKKLDELAQSIAKLEKESAKLYEELGVSPHQIQDFLSDPRNFSKSVYEIIQKQRELLIAALDRKLTDHKNHKRSTPNRLEVGAKGHWIFVR
jgi:hypothetical protein